MTLSQQYNVIYFFLSYFGHLSEAKLHFRYCMNLRFGAMSSIVAAVCHFLQVLFIPEAFG
jgi:hypothetical protein